MDLAESVMEFPDILLSVPPFLQSFSVLQSLANTPLLHRCQHVHAIRTLLSNRETGEISIDRKQVKDGQR